MNIDLLPQPKRHARWPLILATIFVSGILGSIVLFETDSRSMGLTIYPGVSIGGVPLGGKTYEEAKRTLDEAIEQRLMKGLSFVLDGELVTLAPTFTASQDLDLTYDIVRYASDESVVRALRIGRSMSVVGTIMERFSARTRGIEITPPVDIDARKLQEALRINFAHRLTPAVDATILFTPPATFAALPERDGMTLTYKPAIEALTRDLEHFVDRPIPIARIPDTPRIREKDAAQLLDGAETYRAQAPYTLIGIIDAKERTLTITPERVGSWLTVAWGDRGATLDIDRMRVDDYFDAIGPTIEIAPRDAKFSIVNGRVTEFQSSQKGYTIDRERTYANLRRAILGRDRGATIDLIIATTEPKQTTESVNGLGIKELLGVGRSNFKGSPPNRRHNIRTGAKALHGIIIAPGEEFSLLKALGDIDAANGYLPELVIKGNKTVPEFGGGLCQIGTTIFRATMASGLPITERQAHSYSVSYYLENGKPGKDATIYNPKPDFRFRNDTPGSILIQTRVEGDDLFFEFWGTSDGRRQEQTEVKTWGLRKPAPTKIIETEDLEPGKKKCTEKPHNGISAEFTYIVTLASGERREQIFRSTYRPWQEVCLLGVPKGTLEKQKTESSTLPASADTAGTTGQ